MQTLAGGAVRSAALAALGAVTALVTATLPMARLRGQDEAPRNRMAEQTSPYLRSHAAHTVHWQPWGDAAFARALREQKPVFLSIGYSACHWCHVMAKESFADGKIAALLNEHFVCIKVDREERPEVDELAMAAVQAMGQQGGWPLSVFLTPQRQPFFGGTYFPPADQHGRPGFRRVLEHLAKVWREDRASIETGAKELADHLAKALAPELPHGEPTAELLAAVLPAAEASFDAQHGGFGNPPRFAPKFLSANELVVLLALPGERAQELATASLEAMQQGGIHDQLGGGFHRYSTDRAWRVPHFEKMLYDNAQLAEVYLDAFLRTGDGTFASTAASTLDYLLRELQGPHGAFHAAQDSQSDGEEGRFFVWTRAEFDAVLEDQAAAAAGWFGVQQEGPFDGKNVLYRAQPTPGELGLRREQARERLFAARAQRTAPAVDDKVITAWNALAIRALVKGGLVLGERRYLDAAARAGAFLRQELVVAGRARRAWHSGQAPVPGFLEDQAGLAWAMLSLFEATGEASWLRAARELLTVLVADFGAADGNFFLTAADHEALVARSHGTNETAMPSGAALAAQALLRAGLLLGDEALYERGVAVLRANHTLLQQAPFQFASLLAALQFHVAGPREVVVAGEPDDPRTLALLAAVRTRVPAHRVVALVHAGNRAALTELSPLFADKLPIDGAPAAYVCQRGVCAAPARTPEELAL
jgi:uncharacterized protein YyaL (SSP411 family)